MPGAIAGAIDYFQQAVREDPSFALAYSGLADCYWVGWGSKVNLPLAEQYARKAVSLQPELAEGHVSLGVVLSARRHMAEAGKELRRALDLNPNYAMAHHLYAGYLLSLGHLEDALAQSEQARVLDPFSIPVNSMFMAILISSRQYDRALEHGRWFAEQSPQSPAPHDLLWRIYMIQGRVPEAIAERRLLGFFLSQGWESTAAIFCAGCEPAPPGPRAMTTPPAMEPVSPSGAPESMP